MTYDADAGTITNDDSATLSSFVSLAEGDSGATTFACTARLSAAVAAGVDVDVATTDGSAEDEHGDNDYISATDTPSFAGNTSEQQTIDVDVNGDGTEESDEKFIESSFCL